MEFLFKKGIPGTFSSCFYGSSTISRLPFPRLNPSLGKLSSLDFPSFPHVLGLFISQIHPLSRWNLPSKAGSRDPGAAFAFGVGFSGNGISLENLWDLSGLMEQPPLGPWNPIPGTWNPIPALWNPVPASRNAIPGTWNPLPGLWNPIPGLWNPIPAQQRSQSVNKPEKERGREILTGTGDSWEWEDRDQLFLLHFPGFPVSCCRIPGNGGIFHGNDGNEQLGCSLDPQSSSFVLQGHSSSSSKPSSASDSGSSQFFSMDEFPFSSPPSRQWDDFIPDKLEVEFAGNEGGFFHPVGTGGMLRIHIPLENPSLGTQGGAQPPKFHKNSAAPPPSSTPRAFPGASRGICLHPTDPLRARGGLRRPRSRAWQLPWQPYIFLRIPNDSLASAPIHGFFWDAGGCSPCSEGLDPLDPCLKKPGFAHSRLFYCWSFPAFCPELRPAIPGLEFFGKGDLGHLWPSPASGTSCPCGIPEVSRPWSSSCGIQGSTGRDQLPQEIGWDVIPWGRDGFGHSRPLWHPRRLECSREKTGRAFPGIGNGSDPTGAIPSFPLLEFRGSSPGGSPCSS
ncbi:uncharacterized protein LOC120411268 [Corvus cornix cornix]|uniref:uncharacterized protein LOC120411268 n=1 Tax=Corvus cornix cornix TaxID=932674 RepID=UPI00194FAD69|nr:uncharacterized protein LOC120411268 [Corvus cornix cornix]